MTEKTLFIHAGGSKTGSSAIQKFLEINFTQFESFGYAYENRVNSNEVNSGNGFLLATALCKKTVTDDELDSVVLSYFGTCNNAICSSEVIQEITEIALGKLVVTLERLRIKLKIVFYIRNVIPYLTSIYDQAIKRHGEFRSIDEWLFEQNWDHYLFLRNISNTLIKENIEVIHFDSVKKELITNFLAAIGLDGFVGFDKEHIKKLVNRSLNNEERLLLMQVNSKLGSLYGTDLSNHLINIRPEIVAEPVFLNKILTDYIYERFVEETNWINENFFNRQPIVSIFSNLSSKISVNETPRINETQDSNLTKQILEWSLNKICTFMDDHNSSIENKINRLNDLGFLYSGYSNTELPYDFNVITYLLLNRDVFEANIDPIDHFIFYGKSEGRIYKYPKISKQPEVDPSQKKLFFMMIPNTVGPLLKELLANQFKPEQILMHDQPDLEWPINRISEQIKFVSGPINYIDFKEKTELFDFKVVTCLRQPLKQIIAQISHYRHYADAANNLAFEACTKEIQLLVLKLAKLDLASPVALTALYNSLSLQELVIFDNPQIRFLTKNLGDQGKKVGIKELELAMRSLKSIDVVGDVDDMKAFINAVTKVMDWSSLDNVVSEKDDSEIYGMDSNNLDIANALWPFIRYDIALYSQRESFLCKPSELIDGRKD